MTAPKISRRRLLQAGAATAGAAALLPSWLIELAGASTPLGAKEGVLVLVVMAGGNDSLNMVVPTANGAYYSARGALAIPADKALPLGGGVGLHPNLTKVKARFDAGKVAVIQGIGDRSPDLSHFSATARWMGGLESDTADSGWLGRYLDGVAGGDEPLRGVTIGTTVPLDLVGRKRRGIALPPRLDAALSTSAKDDWVRRSATCVRDMYGFFGNTGLGEWGDKLAAANRSAIDLSGGLTPVYKPAPADDLTGHLELCARLINADLGIRVLQVIHGNFDTHADELGTHGNRMTELGNGMDKLFASLSPRFANRVTMLTMSEFGRRFQPNKSNGTDHGTAFSVLAAGERVRGGLYGSQPSLTSLDRNGNLIATVDQRSVFATVLDTWLGADSREVLGATLPNLGFLDRPAT